MRLIFGKAVASLSLSLMLVACGSNQNTASPDAQGPTSHWSGNTYLVDIPQSHWVKPTRDVGKEISPFVPQFLVSVTGSGGNLTATVATAKDGAQDLCNQTQQASVSEADYPKSQIVLPRYPMTFQELNENVTPSVTVTQKSTIHDMTLVNMLPGDPPVTEGTFTVTADIAELAPLFIRPIVPQPATPSGVCDTITNNSTAKCATCAFDSSDNYCLTLGAVQLVATLTSATVKQVSLGDIAASCP
jgi:hypothetical protein